MSRTKTYNRSELSDAIKKHYSRHQKISTWTLWQPLKFALISFFAIVLTTRLYTLLTQSTSPTPLLILLILSITTAGFLQIHATPHIKMDKKSFIAIHNAQYLILSFATLLSSILIIKYAQQILVNLLLLESQSTWSFVTTLSFVSIFYLYLIGILISNIYAKFRRIHNFGIPAWKIILTMPFGFSALWAPGYIIDNTDTKIPSVNPRTKWYKTITDWATSGTLQTIISFITINILSGFFFGFSMVLLTFALTLIFAIWALQSGLKKFTKHIGGKYTTCAIAFNIAILVLILGFRAIVPATIQDVQTTISEPEIIDTNYQP